MITKFEKKREEFWASLNIKNTLYTPFTKKFQKIVSLTASPMIGSLKS